MPAPRLTWWRSGKLLDDTDEEVIHLHSTKFTWFHLHSPEFTWIHLISPAFTWFHLNLPEFTWLHLNSPEFTWIHLNSPDFTCIHMYIILSLSPAYFLADKKSNFIVVVAQNSPAHHDLQMIKSGWMSLVYQFHCDNRTKLIGDTVYSKNNCGGS